MTTVLLLVTVAAAGVHATSTGGPLPRLWRDLNTAALHPALRL
ncbi:hypothetical protein M1P56_16985 [Streptomyces sp. HU2014]|nr:hypothetical protein [Streptomyces sp. HU2014]UQI45930.1 hypothetical protein M1P56_16985 [Streptomyces sp. HU2014]